MSAGYGQFCPVAKAAEVFATRWTPLILREMMSGLHSFNDIHRGVPLLSRAVLVARLRELEKQGIVERRPRPDGPGLEYWLTSAGEDFRGAVTALGQWGKTHSCDRIESSDLDPGLLVWGLQKRVDPTSLPKRRVVLRFEFAGVPASRTKLRIMWLVLDPSGVDVCVKDPGFSIDLTLQGNIRDWVAVFSGFARWRDLAGTALQFNGAGGIINKIPAWFQFDRAGNHESRAPASGRSINSCAN